MTAYTVAIPARDAAATIDAVVRAAAAQYPPPARILVGDDGSRDDTARLARLAGAEIIPHVRSQGLAANRNRLWRACRTELVVFFDADAIPRAGCAAALLAGFADARVTAVGGRGVEAAYATFADRWRASHTPQSHGEAPLVDDWMVMGLCCAFRRAALEAVGGFDERFVACGEDVEISWRLRQAGGILFYDPAAVVDHARSDNLFGVLRQAWFHAKETGRALAWRGQPLSPQLSLTMRALGPALGREIRRLDAPTSGLTVINLAVRLIGLTVGGALGRPGRAF